MKKFLLPLFAFALAHGAQASVTARCAERAFTAKGELDWKGVNTAKLCHGVRTEEQMEAVLSCAKRAYFAANGPLDFNQESSAILCAGAPSMQAVDEIIDCANEAFHGAWATGFDQLMTAELCRTPK